MHNTLDGITNSRDCRVYSRQGHSPKGSSFHTHDYYEVSLIMSGDVITLLHDRKDSGTHPRLLLAGPGTPHLTCLATDSFYSRVNLYIGKEFFDQTQQWHSLSGVFGRNGNIVPLTQMQARNCHRWLEDVDNESNELRKKLLVLLLLSRISDFNQQHRGSEHEPSVNYVLGCLQYMQMHYAEHLVACDIASRFGISRTTLMTHMKQQTGRTFSEHLTHIRAEKAVGLLKQGVSQEEAAARTGLGTGGGLIRAFRRCYGLTPRQYMLENFPYLYVSKSKKAP